MTGMMSPKVDTTASREAAKLAAEEEAKARKAEAQTAQDEEYRRLKQQGRSSTILTTPAATTGTRSLLGG